MTPAGSRCQHKHTWNVKQTSGVVGCYANVRRLFIKILNEFLLKAIGAFVNEFRGNIYHNKQSRRNGGSL